MTTHTIDVSPIEEGRRRNGGTFTALGLLVRRRIWRDRWLVLASAGVVALATVLALSGPDLVARTIDDGAADAVVAAGPEADIVIQVPIGNPGGDNVSSPKGLDVTAFDGLEDTATANLPRRTASVVDTTDAWVLSNSIAMGWSIAAEDVAEAEESTVAPERDQRNGDLVTFGYSPEAEVTLVDGALPGPPPRQEDLLVPGQELEPTEIAISVEVGEALELGIGDLLQVNTPVGETMVLRVSGIVEAADPAAPVWDRFPEFAAPTVAEGGAGLNLRRGTVMVDQALLDALTSGLRTPFPATVVVTIDPAAMTLNLASAISGEMRELPSNSDVLLGEEFEGAAVSVESGLGPALEEYPPRARAAVAQMSIVISGVVAVAAVVIALMAGLLLLRREADISLERARGASVASVAVRLTVESVLVTLGGVAAGLAIATVLTPGVSLPSGLVTCVALVALLSTPLLGALHARGTWTGKREAANRQDRAKVRKARRARRLTLELLVIVVAVLAVLSLRGRGVLQTTTEGVDPFLAATPVLIALAIVVIVIRLYPLPMSVIQFFARRTRGVAGVITLAKSRERIPVLPLLALTLAIAIAVSGSLLVSSVRAGQEQASWDRVGADVRINAELSDADMATLEEQGLTVSRGLDRPFTTVSMGIDYADVFLLAMDQNYPAILEAAGVQDVDEMREIYVAAEDWRGGQPVPSQASQEIIDANVHDDAAVYVGRVYTPVEFIGEATVTPDGWAPGPPYVLMPLEQLMETEFTTPVPLTIAFVSGPGAADAVAALSSVSPEDVVTREGWLAAVQDSALIGGVERAMAIAVIAVGILAAVGLLVTILRGVRERGRALSMLRTQGMGSGYGWWLALAELVPLTLAGVLGGAVAGFAIMALLASTLGMRLLSGGLMDPPIVADWTSLAVIAAGVVALLFFAVAAEVAAHRRNKLSDVLRWGESR